MAPRIGHNQHCRVCGCTDRDGLIAHLADAMWESRREGVMVDCALADAGPMWQRAFRELAMAAIDAIAVPH